MRRYALSWLLVVFALAAWLRTDPDAAIDGVIIADGRPAVGATVGWQGERLRVCADPHGRFQLPRSSKSKLLTASMPGHRIASVVASNQVVTLNLQPLPTDHDDYAWIDPHPDAARANNCGNCHGEIYREWNRSAHGRSAINPKFLSMFGYARTQNPDGSAVCATCHVPTLTSANLEYDVRAAEGVDRRGIHCDYCHKVADVPGGKFGTRFGRDGMRLVRPPNADPLTFGPLDDAVRRGESFAHAPVYKESLYCASCHEGTVFGVHAYGTYSEWLDSPAKSQGKQCQTCHMAPSMRMSNIAPGKGGIERAPDSLAGHDFAGADRDSLRRCLNLRVGVTRTDRGSGLHVEITALNVGHRVPTGFPDRQLILYVAATDAAGRHVEPLEGPRLPRSAGNWSGAPGTLYAKQLTDEKGRSPTPFWIHVDRVIDTRLRPEQPDRRSFLFPPAAKQAKVQLWYRRFWHEMAAPRHWSDNDILCREQVVNLHD